MSKDDIKKTAPYEGGTQQADAVPEDGRAAGYFGDTPYEASSACDTRGETAEYGERYRGKEYGTEAAEDFFCRSYAFRRGSLGQLYRRRLAEIRRSPGLLPSP